MRKLQQIGALSLAIALVIASAPALTAAQPMTVGQFVERIATAKNLDAANAYVAADSLAANGVRLPADIVYTDTLTEGDVVSIARTLGINVRTSDPEADFTQNQADRFLLSFSRELSSTPQAQTSSTPDFDLFDDLVGIQGPGDGPEDGISTDWFWWWKGWYPGYWWSKWQDYWAGKWKGKWKGKGGKKTKKDPH